MENGRKGEPRGLEKEKSMEPTPRPNLLDVVKIDGRWAQVHGRGNYIKYLDDNIPLSINWNDFVLTRKLKDVVVVGDINNEQPGAITQEEIDHIHWGPEQKEISGLKEMVTVFGEYERKKK